MEKGTSKSKKQKLDSKKQNLLLEKQNLDSKKKEVKDSKQTVKNGKQDLRTFLENRLLAVTFNRLHTLLNISLNRMTFIFNNPTKIKSEEVKTLAEIAGLSPHKLVNLTDCGINRLTLAEAKSLGIKY